MEVQRFFVTLNFAEMCFCLKLGSVIPDVPSCDTDHVAFFKKKLLYCIPTTASCVTLLMGNNSVLVKPRHKKFSS
jgi:hypothetical protein